MKKRHISFKDFCKHPASARKTIVLGSAVTCETTVTKCAFCGEHLTQPQTDC